MSLPMSLGFSRCHVAGRDRKGENGSIPSVGCKMGEGGECFFFLENHRAVVASWKSACPSVVCWVGGVHLRRHPLPAAGSGWERVHLWRHRACCRWSARYSNGALPAGRGAATLNWTRSARHPSDALVRSEKKKTGPHHRGMPGGADGRRRSPYNRRHGHVPAVHTAIRECIRRSIGDVASKFS
jgi:hypothetical protein